MAGARSPGPAMFMLLMLAMAAICCCWFCMGATNEVGERGGGWVRAWNAARVGLLLGLTVETPGCGGVQRRDAMRSCGG